MKKIFFLFFVWINLAVSAQVTLQPEIPSAGFMQRNQLWNILAVNSNKATYECRLNLVLTDRVSGQEIFTATSALFTLTPGSRQLSINTLSPVQYNFLTGGSNSSLQTVLPAGMYNACYSLSSTGLKEILLAEECVQFDAEPLSPPLLIFPADSSILENAPSQFSWTPPTPMEMFSRLRYDVLITEIREGQQAAEAIQQNIPFYSESDVVSNVLNYPSSTTAFEKGKWYAWQVVARDDRNYAGKTEIWVFRVMNDSVKKIIEDAPFIKMSKTNTLVTIMYNGILKMEYLNMVNDTEAFFTIYESTDKKQIARSKIPLTQGQNFLKTDLKKYGKLDDKKIYEVSIINSRGEEWLMRFMPVYYK